MNKKGVAFILGVSMLCFNVGSQHIEVTSESGQTFIKKSFRQVLLDRTLKENRKPENIKKYTLSLIKDYNWSASQYSCLYSLWKKESNWHWYSLNKSSGAYGIPQATPGWKMRHAGADWKTNPFTQIRWGLAYIKRNHGTPCVAWQFSKVNNWY